MFTIGTGCYVLSVGGIDWRLVPQSNCSAKQNILMELELSANMSRGTWKALYTVDYKASLRYQSTVVSRLRPRTGVRHRLLITM